MPLNEVSVSHNQSATHVFQASTSTDRDLEMHLAFGRNKQQAFRNHPFLVTSIFGSGASPRCLTANGKEHIGEGLFGRHRAMDRPDDDEVHKHLSFRFTAYSNDGIACGSVLTREQKRLKATDIARSRDQD